MWRSLPLRGAWIEIDRLNGDRQYINESLPLRGAWIEMSLSIPLMLLPVTVAPPAGSVD